MTIILSPCERVRERVDLGGLEDKRSGRQADIGGCSQRKNKFLPLSGKVRMGFNPLISEGESNSPKRTYRLNVLTSQKCAFTLAEVLITLGIIGVVAAITIPTLLSKFQMKVFETAFKKQYSVLQNAINYTVQVEGISACYVYKPNDSISYASINADCVALKDSLISLLNLTSIETPSTYKYATKNEVLSDGGKTINSYCNYDVYASNSNFLTKDGSIVTFYFDSSNFPIIVLDINGLKGPNKWGYDVFFMTLSNHNQYNSREQKIFLTDEFCSIVEKGGRLPRTILTNKEKTEDDDFTTLWK